MRHALEYAGLLGVRELFRHLPPERAVGLGARLGRTWARAGGPRRADAAANLALAFPDSSIAERDELLEKSFANLGRYLAELCLLQGRHRERLLAGIEVEGHEHYEAARAASESGGLIALTAHLGSWELCAAVMATRGYPVSAVHHPRSNPFLERMIGDWRRASRVESIELGSAATGVFRALSAGRVIAVLLDQNAHSSEGVFAPFFGIPASTRSGPARIAMGRSVPVLPVFIFRVGESPRHVVRMQAPLGLDAEGEPGALERNVARMNEVIEAAIRTAPEQWLWAHRRFKTRPAGHPALYPPRRRRTKA